MDVQENLSNNENIERGVIEGVIDDEFPSGDGENDHEDQSSAELGYTVEDVGPSEEDEPSAKQARLEDIMPVHEDVMRENASVGGYSVHSEKDNSISEKIGPPDMRTCSQYSPSPAPPKNDEQSSQNPAALTQRLLDQLNSGIEPLLKSTKARQEACNNELNVMTEQRRRLDGQIKEMHRALSTLTETLHSKERLRDIISERIQVSNDATESLLSEARYLQKRIANKTQCPKRTVQELEREDKLLTSLMHIDKVSSPLTLHSKSAQVHDHPNTNNDKATLPSDQSLPGSLDGTVTTTADKPTSSKQPRITSPCVSAASSTVTKDKDIATGFTFTDMLNRSGSGGAGGADTQSTANGPDDGDDENSVMRSVLQLDSDSGDELKIITPVTVTQAQPRPLSPAFRPQGGPMPMHANLQQLLGQRSKSHHNGPVPAVDHLRLLLRPPGGKSPHMPQTHHPPPPPFNPSTFPMPMHGPFPPGHPMNHPGHPMHRPPFPHMRPPPHMNFNPALAAQMQNPFFNFMRAQNNPVNTENSPRMHHPDHPASLHNNHANQPQQSPIPNLDGPHFPFNSIQTKQELNLVNPAKPPNIVSPQLPPEIQDSLTPSSLTEAERRQGIKTGQSLTFNCDFPGCSARCSTKQLLEAHKIKNHATVPQHLQVKTFRNIRCHICNKQFASKGSLKAHVFLHTGHKPFRCSFCNHRSATKGQMKVHIGRLHKAQLDELQRSGSCSPKHSLTSGLSLPHRRPSGDGPLQLTGEEEMSPAAMMLEQLNRMRSPITTPTPMLDSQAPNQPPTSSSPSQKSPQATMLDTLNKLRSPNTSEPSAGLPTFENILASLASRPPE